MKKLIICFVMTCISLYVDGQPLGIQYDQSSTSLASKKGSVFLKSMYAPSLEGNLLGESPYRTLKIYLPPGYYDYPDNRYPVIYYLPAIESSTRSYNDPYYYCGVGAMLDELISEELIMPMILVVPDNETDYDGSLWVNSYVVGNWEDFMVNDLVAFMDSNYRTIPRKESRGMQGYGSGGAGALRIAMKYPNVFSIVETVNAWILDFQSEFFPVSSQMLTAAKLSDYNYDTEFPLGNGEDWFINVWQSCAANFAPDSAFNSLMGRMHIDTGGSRIDSVWEEYLMHDPVSLISAYRDSLMKLNHIQLDVYKSYGNTSCVPSAQAYSDSLSANGIPHTLNVSFLDACGLSRKSYPMFSEHFWHDVPYINILNTPWLDRNDTLRITSSFNGFVKGYILPDTMIMAGDSVKKYAIDSVYFGAMDPGEILLKNFPLGTYRVYGISDNGGVSTSPPRFHVVEYKPKFQVKVLDDDTREPLIDCSVKLNGVSYVQDSESGLNFTGLAYGSVQINVTKSNYFDFDTLFDLHADLSLDIYLESSIISPELKVVGAPLMDWSESLNITLSQSGLIVLAPEGTPSDLDSIMESAVRLYPASANKSIQKFLYGIPPGDYRIYGISNLNQLAEESFSLTIIEKFPDCFIEVYSMEWIPLDSCILVLNSTDSIPGIEGRFDLGGLVYDSCRISVSRIGYRTKDTSLIIFSNLTLKLQLSQDMETGESIEKDASYVRLYPNPVSEKLVIERKTAAPYELIVRNSSGQTILRQSEGGSKRIIDLSDYSPGIYIMTIRTQELVLRKKFIKH